MAIKKAENITVNDYLRDMTLEEFICLFCNVYDYDIDEWVPVVLWEKQRDLSGLLDYSRKLFWPKARQVGGSMMAGDLATKVAVSEPNSDIYIISKTEPDAQYFLKDKVKSVLDHLPKIEGIEWPKYDPYKERIEFDNGSTITSLTSAENAGRGRSAVRLIIMDEAAAIEHARQIWKGASPAIEKHPRGQMIVISNSESGSWFNIMLKKINEGKTEGIDMYFMNSWTDPTRDAAWKAIEITQYDNEVDFYTEYPETIEHMFLKREGYVFPSFKSKEGSPHVNSFDPEFGNHRLLFGYDHGFEHYAVFLLMLWDQYADHLYIFDEMFAHQQDVFNISNLILNKIEHWEREGMPTKSWRNIADYAIFAKTGQKPVAELLKTYTGLSFSKSIKFNEQGSIDMLRGRFTRDKITFHPRCRNSIEQTRDLMFDKNGKPIDKNNDATDILKYVCADLRQQKRPEPIKKPKAYDSKFNKYKRNLSFLAMDKDPEGMGAEFDAQRANSWQQY